jgi:sarcosine oxidase
MAHYDLIVLGTGGVGSAALYHSARRGLKTLGLDRFPPAHDRGSSHGESRMIRLSYFEHPDYVPLLRRAYALWDELDASLLRRCGVLYVGAPDSASISGVRRSANRYDLRLQDAPTAAANSYRVPAQAVGIFEPDAGYLPVEQCVTAHLDAALAAGAEHRWGESVTGWSESGGGIDVTTNRGRYSAERLIIAGGPWAGSLLDRLHLPLRVLRKHLHWFSAPPEGYELGFFYDLEHGQFYGFPAANGRIKVGEHSGGELVADPLNASREPDADDCARIDDFIANYLPGVSLQRVEHQVCFYTMSPDAQFIVDRIPGSGRIAFAAGLSGHGFKFTPVLGEILVDLVTQGHSAMPIEFLGLNRPALTAGL